MRFKRYVFAYSFFDTFSKIDDCIGFIQILREEITPKLDKLREEKRAFLEFQKKSSELERLSRLVIAYDFVNLSSRSTKALDQIANHDFKMKASKADKGRIEGEVSRMEKDAAEIIKRRDEEMKKGGKIGLLESEQKELAKEIAKSKTRVEIIESTIVEEEKKVADLELAGKDVSRLQSSVYMFPLMTSLITAQ